MSDQWETVDPKRDGNKCWPAHSHVLQWGDLSHADVNS